MPNRSESLPSPEEVLQQVSTNPKVRNAIAYAHLEQYQAQPQRLRRVAILYPHRYSVTDEQVQAAKEQLEQDKQAAIARLMGSGTLLMIGMGGDRTPTEPDEINNHRVRAEFQAANGEGFFLEVGYLKQGMYCTHSIDRTMEELAKEAHSRY